MANNNVNCIKIEHVKITNGDFFTSERLAEWRIFIAKCCRDVCEGLIKKVDPKCFVSYFLSEALVDEVVGDAVIGMAKIINKTPHHVEHPNAFKIAAYLGYWFLRHKPISILYPDSVDLNRIQVAAGVKIDAEYLSWQLKHINELVAVNIVTTFIFDFEHELCNNRQCSAIKKQNVFDGEPAFPFNDFNQQRQIIMQKLTYYFTYRAIAPKIIEHMLEGYAFHPAWYLTGSHWSTDISEDILQVSDDSKKEVHNDYE
ncbi:MAG: hypothetical protein K1W17_02765 [Oscillospiraceae bacterium]